VLRLMGLFDRPADAGGIEALLKEPAIPGLTQPLVGLADDDWEFCLSGLEAARLLTVNRDTSAVLPSLDAHPLLREYFASQLREEHPDAWRTAHRRLYEHLCTTTKEGDQPTLEDLQPLCQAVTHGCAGGKHQEAYLQLYWKRIAKKHRKLIRDKLGAVATDLSLLANFVELPWREADKSLEPKYQASVLVNSGLVLRLEGRFKEAEEGLVSGKQLYIRMPIASRIADASRHLGQLYSLLGCLEAARQASKDAVRWSWQNHRPGFERMASLCGLGDVLHQLGNLRAAQAVFRKAEAIQPQIEPRYRQLSRLQGYRYCDLLLSLGCFSEVICRSARMINWAKKQDFLLGGALARLSLARGCMERRLRTGTGNWEQIEVMLNKAVEALRLSNQQDALPRGLLVLAEFQHHGSRPEKANEALQEVIDIVHRDAARGGVMTLYLPQYYMQSSCLKYSAGDPNGAQADLDEAWDIAERGPMRLHMADIHLYRARLFFREKDYPWESPAADLAAAEKLINECGYHRRDEELADAKRAILGVGV